MKLKPILFYIFILLIVISCKNNEKTILKPLVNKYLSHKSINYDISLKNKYKSKDDTIKFKTNCTLIRNEKDTVFGGSIWYSVFDTLEYYYDTKNIYTIHHNNKIITKYNISDNWVIGKKLINDYFFKPELLNEISNNESFTYKDTLINSNNYIKSIFYKKKQIKIISNKNIIHNVSSNVNYNSDGLFEEKTYSNIRYDKESESGLNERLNNYIKDYKLINYKEQPIKVETLSNFSEAPVFNGYDFSNGKKFELKKYKNKIIILDFWYMSCPPCIKAIPHLNKISEKYDGVVVLGLNSNDSDKSAKPLLEKFILKHKMEYETIIIDKDVEKNYLIRSFPTLYILNKDKKIIFSKIGYTNNLYSKLDSIIKSELKKNL